MDALGVVPPYEGIVGLPSSLVAERALLDDLAVQRAVSAIAVCDEEVDDVAIRLVARTQPRGPADGRSVRAYGMWSWGEVE